MSPVIQKIILFFVGVIFLFPYIDGAEAAVYKWRDENGKIHFTDDPNNVPEKFRQDKMKFRPLPKTSPKEEITKAKKKEDAKESIAPEEIKDKDSEKKSTGLTEAEKSAANAVIAFFEEDMPRYDSIYAYPLSNRTSRLTKLRKLRNAVIATIPQKQDLVKQISALQLPLLKEVTNFLQTMIAEDERLKKVLPQMLRNTRQRVNKMANRLKAQADSEAKFIEQLEEALKDPAESEKK
ncbi:MAG: DUF4124 domain-containing protein [Nitrospina sp.]|jgi:hypothetical protein|nr:DUF4124 domain-containing protein [Nitrospina sp.]